MIDFDINEPIYVQICNYIKDMIYNGQLKPGDQAPSIRKLAIDMNVNPNTVARAYMELERENVIKSFRGSLSTVTLDLEKIQSLKKEKIKKLIHYTYQQLVKLGLNHADIKEEIDKFLQDWAEKHDC